MDEEENPDIAAMMGFGSFGGTKKRKFDQANSPKSKIDASGANSTRLGVRMKSDVGEQSNEFHATDDATIGSTDEAQPPAMSKSKGKGKAKQVADAGLAGFLARGQALPEAPPSAQQVEQPLPEFGFAKHTDEATFSYGGPPISRSELHALQRGVKDEKGDTAYFLPSFVEDPWEKLEKQRR